MKKKSDYKLPKLQHTDPALYKRAVREQNLDFRDHCRLHVNIVYNLAVLNGGGGDLNNANNNY